MRVIGCAVVLESFRKLVTRADQAVVLQVAAVLYLNYLRWICLPRDENVHHAELCEVAIMNWVRQES